MQHWWIAWQMSKLRQREVLREADRIRALRNGQRKPAGDKEILQPKAAFFRPLLASLCCCLGQRLISLGSLLKQQ